MTRQIRIWPDSQPALGTTLGEAFTLTADDLDMRVKIEELAFGHGGRDIGDGRVSSRTFTIEGRTYGADMTSAQFQTAIEEIYDLCRWSDLRLKIVDSSKAADTRYLKVGRLQSVRHTHPDGLDGRLAKVRIKFTAACPFWIVSSGLTSAAASGLTQSFSLTNSGQVNTGLAVTVSCDVGAIPSFRVVNNTGLTGCTVTQATAAAGYVTIDSDEGTVMQGSTNWIRYFEGHLPTILPGVNSVDVIFSATPTAGTTVSIGWLDKSMVGP